MTIIHDIIIAIGIASFLGSLTVFCCIILGARAERRAEAMRKDEEC